MTRLRHHMTDLASSSAGYHNKTTSKKKPKSKKSKSLTSHDTRQLQRNRITKYRSNYQNKSIVLAVLLTQNSPEERLSLLNNWLHCQMNVHNSLTRLIWFPLMNDLECFPAAPCSGCEARDDSHWSGGEGRLGGGASLLLVGTSPSLNSTDSSKKGHHNMLQ